MQKLKNWFIDISILCFLIYSLFVITGIITSETDKSKVNAYSVAQQITEKSVVISNEIKE